MSVSMIPCSLDCVYQKDGYCQLEIPTVITDLVVQNGCVHRIQTQAELHKNRPLANFSIHPDSYILSANCLPLQMLL